MTVKKAVIPAAGFGTRFLPATKSQPKEMLPIVDTPVIQYVVEEAVSCGITDILMIIGRGKRTLEEYFDRAFELENELESKLRTDELEMLRRISSMANIHFIWQKQLLGLGDAVLHAKQHVGNEPFAVLLGDTVLRSDPPVLQQLINTHDQKGGSVVALEQVPPEKVGRYGIMKGSKIENSIYEIQDFVEKPKKEQAPSNLAIAGRYVFTSDIFDYLEKTERGLNNEIQLTDAMREMVKKHAFHGVRFNGVRYDIGNKLDFIKTNLIFGLNNNDMYAELSQFVLDMGKRIQNGEQIQ